MSSQGIIGQAVAFRDQLKIGLTGLEEDLNLPSFVINPNALFLREFRIRADKGDPVFLILRIADT